MSTRHTPTLAVTALVAGAALELSKRPLVDKPGVNYIVYGLTR
jgi:hypothetical protein